MAAKSIAWAIGVEIRLRRQAMGLSQEALADAADLHRNFIGLLERGQRNMSLPTLQAVASALKVTMTDLVSRAERRL